jgi:hypothetical protein
MIPCRVNSTRTSIKAAIKIVIAESTSHAPSKRKGIAVSARRADRMTASLVWGIERDVLQKAMRIRTTTPPRCHQIQKARSKLSALLVDRGSNGATLTKVLNRRLIMVILELTAGFCSGKVDARDYYKVNGF